MTHWSLPVVIGLTVTVFLLLGYKVIYGAETNITVINSASTDINQYLEEMKYNTCHVIFDIYNLTSYYRCIGQ